MAFFMCSIMLTDYVNMKHMKNTYDTVLTFAEQNFQDNKALSQVKDYNAVKIVVIKSFKAHAWIDGA